MAETFLCPHCGETIDTDPDPGGGEEQTYIEDCPVCCRPNRISVVFSADDDAFHVYADREI